VNPRTSASEDWIAMLDFADKPLRGMKIERRVDRFPADPALQASIQSPKN
jgi:hypothetical protein